MGRLLATNATFRRLFFAHAISRAGDAFNTVALVVLVFTLTGSGLGVAGTVAFEVVPILLLGPLAGLTVDRYPRRSVMVAADLGRAVLVLVLAGIGDSVPVAYAVAFGLSALTLLFNPAASSTLPDSVEPDDLVDANTALWTSAVAVQIILAPLAGLMIAAIGTGPAFVINALSYLISATLLVGLDVGRSPATVARQGWHAAMGGVRAVYGHSLLRRLAVVQLLASLSAGATSGLLVVLAVQRLDVGAAAFGMLLAAIGTGATLGPLLLHRWVRPSEPGWLFGPYAVRAVVDLVLGITTSPIFAGAALILYGTATSTGMIAYQATLQRVIPSEVRGRVFSCYDVLWNGGRLLSLGLGGILADAVGVQVVYLAGGVLLLLAAGIGLLDRGPPASAGSH
jgi:MFS family permease